MRNYFKFAVYLWMAIGVSWIHAGSYEDFFAAVNKDDPAVIGDLMQRGFDPNTPSPDGQHALYLALRDGAPKAARALVDWPATKVDARNSHDETPLMMAALKGHLDMVKKLVERDADVNKPGWAPLHYAATSGHLAVMELLLEHHAFIDAESPNGTTPLMMAAHYGTPAAVKLLLDAGADTTMKNQQGLSAIDFARRGNRTDAAELIARHIRDQQPRGKW